MSALTVIYRFIAMNLLTVYYSVIVLFLFFINFLKNPFSNPWAQKLRLEPPANLADPKYGTHKYVKVNDIKLHYVESGDPSKPLMIFVHGFPEFWYSWRYQILHFQKDYWCVAVDMRGYGDSERPEGKSSYKIDLLAKDIRELIRHLGREKCVLVAHDWGGVIACKFRDLYPEALEVIVMLASMSLEGWHKEIWTNADQRKKSWYTFFYQIPALPELFLQMNNLDVFDKIMLPKGKDTITQQDLDCFKYWFGKQCALTPPINYYRANITYKTLEKKYDDKKVPFLIAHAANDSYISHSILDRMKSEEYAHLETAIVPDCGHFLQQEEPEKVNQLIRDFLNKHKVS